MLSSGAIAQRVRAPLSRILWSRNKWPGELSRYSTYEPQETPTVAYAVRRGDPELVGPAFPTPRETKPLSDTDDMYILRKHVSLALLYRGREHGVHPAGVIRRALSEALVHYYPLAGRLREIEGDKLVVDCTGEGVLFVQADADVRLADLEGSSRVRMPFPCWDQLLFDVEGSSGVLNTPLLLIQVTRLLCGGFVLALRFCHNMCDGVGIAQFMNAVSELARGLPSLTVTPVWSRELIKARWLAKAVARWDLLPRLPPPPDMVTRYFHFSASDIAAMKKSLPQLTPTTFDALAAFVWRARTAALELPPGELTPLVIAFNARGAGMLSLPAGYYGNAVVSAAAMVDSETLCRGSLGDAVALVRLAKASVNTDNIPSMVDKTVLFRQQTSIPANWFSVSDARRLGLASVDFGWGEPVFADPADPFTAGVGFFIAVKDRDGEDAVCVRVMLPPPAMLRFADELTRSLARHTP